MRRIAQIIVVVLGGYIVAGCHSATEPTAPVKASTPKDSLDARTFCPVILQNVSARCR